MCCNFDTIHLILKALKYVDKCIIVLLGFARFVWVCTGFLGFVARFSWVCTKIFLGLYQGILGFVYLNIWYMVCLDSLIIDFPANGFLSPSSLSSVISAVLAEEADACFSTSFLSLSCCCQKKTQGKLLP